MYDFYILPVVNPDGYDYTQTVSNKKRVRREGLWKGEGERRKIEEGVECVERRERGREGWREGRDGERGRKGVRIAIQM